MIHLTTCKCTAKGLSQGLAYATYTTINNTQFLRGLGFEGIIMHQALGCLVLEGPGSLTYCLVKSHCFLLPSNTMFLWIRFSILKLLLLSIAPNTILETFYYFLTFWHLSWLCSSQAAPCCLHNQQLLYRQTGGLAASIAMHVITYCSKKFVTRSRYPFAYLRLFPSSTGCWL